VPAGERSVERAQLAIQHTHRPPVDDDVVQREDEDVLVSA